jgi:hypothetical protein
MSRSKPSSCSFLTVGSLAPLFMQRVPCQFCSHRIKVEELKAHIVQAHGKLEVSSLCGARFGFDSTAYWLRADGAA